MYRFYIGHYSYVFLVPFGPSASGTVKEVYHEPLDNGAQRVFEQLEADVRDGRTGM
jgi:hypothetical protein